MDVQIYGKISVIQGKVVPLWLVFRYINKTKDKKDYESVCFSRSRGAICRNG